jgi:putative SOS response-associated peptidase YedK
MLLSFTQTINELVRRYNTEYLDNYYEQRINAGEGETFVAFTAAAPQTIDIMKWGFKSEKTKGKTIGLVKGKGIVKDPYCYIAIRQHRCIIPATSFAFRSGDGIAEFYVPEYPIFSIGGVYSEYQYEETSYRTFAIVTVEATKSILPSSPIMPLILTSRNETYWLKSERVLSQITRIIYPLSDKEIKMVGNVRQDDNIRLGSKSPRKSKPDNNIDLEPWWKRGK